MQDQDRLYTPNGLSQKLLAMQPSHALRTSSMQKTIFLVSPLKPSPRHLQRLLHVRRDSRTLALPRPGIVKVQVLAELAVHQDMRSAYDGGHDMSVQSIRYDKLGATQQLKARDRLCVSALVLAAFLDVREFCRISTEEGAPFGRMLLLLMLIGPLQRLIGLHLLGYLFVLVRPAL